MPGCRNGRCKGPVKDKPGASGGHSQRATGLEGSETMERRLSLGGAAGHRKDGGRPWAPCSPSRVRESCLTVPEGDSFRGRTSLSPLDRVHFRPGRLEEDW